LSKKECNKCQRYKDKDYFWENDSVAVYFSRPDYKGHTVVMCKKHHDNLTELSPKEAHDFIDAWQRCGRAIEKVLKPDIINYQINCNWTRHVHGHLYPRFPNQKDFHQPLDIPKKDEKFKKHKMSDKEKSKIIELIKRGR